MNLFFLIRIVLLIHSNWMCHFKKDVILCNNYVPENCFAGRKYDTRIYRLLTKYHKNNDSNIVKLNGEIPNNGVSERKDISYNEKGATTLNVQSDIFSSKKGRKQAKAMKNKSNTFETKKYSFLEKKIFKELDYMDFLKSNRTITNKVYKKITCKKYGLRLATPLILLLLLLVVLLVDLSLGLASGKSLLEVSGLWKPLQSLSTETNGWLYTFIEFVKEYLPWLSKRAEWVEETGTNTYVIGNTFGIIMYFLPFFILGVILILWIIYYHKKVKKFEKIKFRKG
ncbi:fam-l protein [Plasmodium malariae]|uniref:Fam-l protein n=1 Tax=Plasmodium malariae TaxID=5858 RepID=A0A1D3JGR1_PLAMA|nr:fam-l protein [Plasmodium malariae]SBT85479.1 fam-l protein [Plasmodium malariae]